jgi:hypothetical protein
MITDFPERALILLENPQTSLVLSLVSKVRVNLEHWRQTQRLLGYISVELRVLSAGHRRSRRYELPQRTIRDRLGVMTSPNMITPCRERDHQDVVSWCQQFSVTQRIFLSSSNCAY